MPLKPKKTRQWKRGLRMYNKKQNFIILFFKIVIPILMLVILSSYFFLKKIEDDKKDLMYEKVQSMATLMHTVYDFDAKHALKLENNLTPSEATLSQIQETFNQFKNDKAIRLTYLLGRLSGNEIEYLAYSTGEKPHNVHILDRERSESMSDALEGFSAVKVTHNFDGEKVFTAFTNIAGTPWALVVEQSYEDHIAPFKEIALSVAVLSVLVLFVLYFILAYFENKNSALIKSSEDRFRHMVESTSDLVWEIDENAIFTYMSDQVKSILGYSKEECLGKTPFDFMKEKESSRVRAIFEKILDENSCIVDVESLNFTKDEKEIVVLTNGTPFYNSVGKLMGYRGISKNITVAKKHKEQMKKLAYFDLLTGLANRKNILNRIEEEVQYSLRNETNSALVYLDLDGFKHINDTLGHNHGDEVLKIVACRLQESVREFDVVGRVGGDEFVILVRGQEKECQRCKDQLLVLKDRVKESINRPIIFEGEKYSVGVSMGVAFIPQDAKSANEAVKKADSAMYKAKELGKNRAIFYDITLQEEVEKSHHLKAEIIEGLKNDEFIMFYQAQYSIEGDTVVGYEALVRWDNPQKGIMEASEFMPNIEKFGLYLELDKYVCNHIYRDLHELSLRNSSLRIAVNISAKSFEEDSFIAFVEDKVHNHGVDASKITLEITENAFLYIVNNSYIDRIIALGFKISIDDFGTGYSNLSYLSSLKYHEIKLDKSFVQGITRSEKEKQICKLILNVCKELNVKVVAEGVETEAQLAFLREEDVDVIQGYIYAVPEPLKAIKLSNQS